jgi:hypothetical protein
LIVIGYFCMACHHAVIRFIDGAAQALGSIQRSGKVSGAGLLRCTLDFRFGSLADIA